MRDSETIEQQEAEDTEGYFADEQPSVEVSSSSRKKSKRASFKRMLSYRWIIRNIPFFLFMSVLAVIYIYNGHLADKTVRHMTRVNQELKELKYEYKTMKSEVMFRSKQSELAKAVEPFGLKELLQPPVILNDSSAEKK